MTYQCEVIRPDGSRERQELHAVLADWGRELPNHKSAIDNLNFSRADLRLEWRKID